MTTGKGIAVAGIWIGVGLSALGAGVAAVIATLTVSES